MEPAGQELQLRDLGRAVNKRRRLVLSVLAATLLIAGLQAFLGPKIYRSQVKVELQQQSSFIIRSDPTGSGGSRLTPATEAEYIRSDPFQSLTYAVATLAEGYGLDIPARRTPDEMYAVVDSELFRYPLPKFFGYLVLKQKARLAGERGEPEAAVAKQYSNLVAKGPDAFQSRFINSSEKDEAVKQAGAMATLAQRAGLDAFKLSASEIEAKAPQVMATPALRAWKDEPLRGRDWAKLPLEEQGPAVVTLYRYVTEKHPDEDARKAKLDRVNLRELKEPGMLEVGFETYSPERSRLYADTIATVVVWKNLSALKADAETRRRRLEEQLWGVGGSGGGLTATLEKADESIGEAKRSARIPDIKGEIESRQTQMTTLRQLMDRRAAEVVGLESEIADLRRSLNGTPRFTVSPKTDENPALAGAKGALVQAKADLASAEATYKPNSSRLESFRARVREVEASLQAEQAAHPQIVSSTRTPNSVYESLEKELATAEARLRNVRADQEQNRAQLNALEAEVAKLPSREVEVAGVTRGRSAQDDAYKWLSLQYYQAKLDETSRQPTAKIVETALDPGDKVRPKKIMTMFLGLVLGLVLSLGAAFLAEGLDTRVRTQEQANRALGGLPVLGAIPRQSGRPLPLALAADGQLAISEAYRALRTSIQAGAGNQGMKSILVTSAGLGEGKSTTVANLALAMARAGARIVVIDADLRRPTLHEYFGVPKEPGLTDVLRGKLKAAQALRESPIPGVWVLPSGDLSGAAATLLDTDAMRRLLDELAQGADVLILDSPAALPVPDAGVLSSMVDGTLLVLGSGQVARDAAAQAQAALVRAGGRVIGAVLNRADLGPDDPTYSYTTSAGKAKA
ncbi:MAG TPA: polysaccharide biosynthesis tyrosine autokinase [Armatimonadota bacterium]